MSLPAFEVPRRSHQGRRPEMAARILDAAVEEVAVTGFEGMTVRLVAARAGVSAATVYAYFSSKEHLLTAEFWRRMTALPQPEYPAGATVGQRIELSLGAIALLVADEPELAAGVTTSLMAHDADVIGLRNQMGDVFLARVEQALGDRLPAAVVPGLTMAFIGSMLSAGMGNLGYRDIPSLLGGFAEVLEHGA
ncbi:MAG: TetR family transcriptional regulator [Frankiales bacterium]|nr:TetR family transcriptional regulator [Frankiales bacterium]